MPDEKMQRVGPTTSWEYIQDDGIRMGPLDSPQIVELLARGVLHANTVLIDVVTQKKCKLQEVSRFRHYLENTTHETPAVVTFGERWNLWAILMERHGLQRVVGGLVIILCLAAGLVLFNALTRDPEAAVPDQEQAPAETGDRAGTAEVQASPAPDTGPASANVAALVVEADAVVDESTPPEAPASPDLLGPEAEIGEQLRVYNDKTSPSNHFTPAPIGDPEEAITFDDAWLDNPHGGGSSIRIVYRPTPGVGEEWAGISWQQPRANWGVKQEGLDLSRYNALIFWARGERGGETISEVRVGGIGLDSDVPYPDSGVASIGPVRLTDRWQRYVVNLSEMDRTYVSGGLAVTLMSAHSESITTVYLDDISFARVEGLKTVSVPLRYPVYAYHDGASLIHRFGPPDIMGTQEDVSYDPHCSDKPLSGATCTRVAYQPGEVVPDRWSGMYWQTTPGGWGRRPGGLDLSEATRLTFWLRGEKGGERIEELGFGGVKGKFGDTARLSVGPIILTDQWQKFSLNLADLDLSRVVGGFMWSSNAELNPRGAVFYLDEIRFEK